MHIKQYRKNEIRNFILRKVVLGIYCIINFYTLRIIRKLI